MTTVAYKLAGFASVPLQHVGNVSETYQNAYLEELKH